LEIHIAVVGRTAASFSENHRYPVAGQTAVIHAGARPGVFIRAIRSVNPSRAGCAEQSAQGQSFHSVGTLSSERNRFPIASDWYSPSAGLENSDGFVMPNSNGLDETSSPPGRSGTASVAWWPRHIFPE